MRMAWGTLIHIRGDTTKAFIQVMNGWCWKVLIDAYGHAPLYNRDTLTRSTGPGANKEGLGGLQKGTQERAELGEVCCTRHHWLLDLAVPKPRQVQ